MKRWAGVLSMVLLAGCSTSESRFVPEYAELYCSYYVDCADPAQLVFDGVSSVDDCLAVIGPEVEADGASCKYKGGKARKCLKAMELMTCPAEGTDLEQVLPPICSEVYVECIPGGEQAIDDTAI